MISVFLACVDRLEDVQFVRRGIIHTMEYTTVISSHARVGNNFFKGFIINKKKKINILPIQEMIGIPNIIIKLLERTFQCSEASAKSCSL